MPGYSVHISSLHNTAKKSLLDLGQEGGKLTEK